MSDKRQAYRFIQSLDQNFARLQTRRGEVVGELLDHSSRGFGVKMPKNIKVQKNEVLELDTVEGVFEVRVAYSIIDGDQARLGLELLRSKGETKIARSSKRKTAGSSIAKISVLASLSCILFLFFLNPIWKPKKPVNGEAEIATVKETSKTETSDN